MFRITGMRASMSSEIRFHSRPMKPAVRAPVKVSARTRITRPSPGSANGR